MRKDPIRENHFKPAERSELAGTYCFYLGAATSFLPLLLERSESPRLYNISCAAFVVFVVANFVIGILNRLYFLPRAEDARRMELISNAFDFDLITERTAGYYNNDEKDPLRRIGLSTLENLFFTKAILQKMAPGVRLRIILYFVAWLCALLWRETPLDWLTTAAQVLFSEAIVSRWLRLEWARQRAERIFDSTHSHYQLGTSKKKLSAYAIAAFAEYEAGKALGGLLLSTKIFDLNNARLTAEWESVKAGLRSAASSSENGAQSTPQ